MLGITKANVDEIKAKTTDPETRAFLGLEGEFGSYMGIPTTTGATRSSRRSAITARTTTLTFGPKALGLPRGWNKLYNNGGLQYPLPWR